MAARLVEYIVVYVPGAVDRNAACEFGCLVEPLEHGHVGVRTEFVAVNLGIWEPDRHLVVARIGEGDAVGHMSNAAFGLIAKNLTVRRHRAPNERKQYPATLLGSVAPVFVFERLIFHPAAAVLGVEEERIRTGKYLLPAQPVADDQYHGFGFRCARIRADGYTQRQYE